MSPRLRDAPGTWLIAVPLLALAGCATAPQPRDPEAPPAERAVPPEPTTDPGTPQPAPVGEPAAPEE
ncbi:MAG TPA: hypothetical protein VJM11_20880, partial [Nevskiaceae bacterium]|nr:hypothetical protein [Nevskiaceae bacterium]